MVVFTVIERDRLLNVTIVAQTTVHSDAISELNRMRDRYSSLGWHNGYSYGSTNYDESVVLQWLSVYRKGMETAELTLHSRTVS